VPELAVITGGSRGIGLASARALGRRGMRLVAIAKDAERLERSVADLTREGLSATGFCCDVANAEAMREVGDAVLANHGTPLVVVANAGVVHRGEVHTLAVDAFDRTVAVNLRGTFLLAHAFVGAMRERGRGRFLAIASISATLGTAGSAAYNASKWGVVGFVKSLAEELHGTGVQALAINPGSVETDMLVGSPFAAQMIPDDVARLVTFAALDAPEAMNGAALDIFGP
jgi:3-oxoacyl-[acyl-carrier protein] reductase